MDFTWFCSRKVILLSFILCLPIVAIQPFSAVLVITSNFSHFEPCLAIIFSNLGNYINKNWSLYLMVVYVLGTWTIDALGLGERRCPKP